MAFVRPLKGKRWIIADKSYCGQWSIAIRVGKNWAGYIGGSTMFIAWKPRVKNNWKNRRWTSGLRIGQLYMGWTRNGNIIPLCAH